MATAEGHVVIVRIAGHVGTEVHAVIARAAAVAADAMVPADAMALAEAVQAEIVPEETAPEETAPAAIVPAALVPMPFLNVHGQSACAQVAHIEQPFLTHSR